KDLQAGGQEFTNLDTGVPLAKAELPVVIANAYLGGWGITAALQAGADVVICGRVTDASLVTGPAAWWHGWRRDDWDALAGAAAGRRGAPGRAGSRRGTSWRGARGPPAATTASGTRPPTAATRGSRSPRSPPTAAASSPSTTAPAGSSRPVPSPPSCSTRS